MPVSKKDVELWRLERFKSFISDFPSGNIESTEEPDFLVRSDSRVVGIELTDLHQHVAPGQVPQQASEAMRHRVVARAQEIYTSGAHPPVLASFHLDDRIHIKKPEVEALAMSLAQLVIENIPSPNSSSEVPSDWDDMREIPSILFKLSVHRLDVVTKTSFSAPGATWVGTISRSDIERALASKDPKYAAYRARCGEAWLVINSNIETMSTWFEIDLDKLDEPFATNFDRVFLVQHFGGQAHELQVSAINSQAAIQ